MIIDKDAKKTPNWDVNAHIEIKDDIQDQNFDNSGNK